MTPAAIDNLRLRLMCLREDLLVRLESELDLGFLSTLADVNATLATLDTMAGDAFPAERAVVSDDGETPRLTIYGADAALAVPITPRQAIVLSLDLLAVALRYGG